MDTAQTLKHWKLFNIVSLIFNTGSWLTLRETLKKRFHKLKNGPFLGPLKWHLIINEMKQQRRALYNLNIQNYEPAGCPS